MIRTENDTFAVSNYLALGTKEEREFAAAHARWMRQHAAEIRPSNPEEADELEKAATELETAIERRESAASKTNG